jgi:hypothetical protein
MHRKLLTLTFDQKTIIFKYKRNNLNAKLKFKTGHFEKSFGLEQGGLKLKTISSNIKPVR